VLAATSAKTPPADKRQRDVSRHFAASAQRRRAKMMLTVDSAASAPATFDADERPSSRASVANERRPTFCYAFIRADA
jgi:hypothetical protein